jgi:hypothetical protein
VNHDGSLEARSEGLLLPGEYLLVPLICLEDSLGHAFLFLFNLLLGLLDGDLISLILEVETNG